MMMATWTGAAPFVGALGCDEAGLTLLESNQGPVINTAIMKIRSRTTTIWNAVTGHRFGCFGDSSPKQGRVQRPGVQSRCPYAFDGDRSPAQSADESAHSKTRGCGNSRDRNSNEHPSPTTVY